MGACFPVLQTSSCCSCLSLSTTHHLTDPVVRDDANKKADPSPSARLVLVDSRKRAEGIPKRYLMCHGMPVFALEDRMCSTRKHSHAQAHASAQSYARVHILGCSNEARFYVCTCVFDSTQVSLCKVVVYAYAYVYVSYKHKHKHDNVCPAI